MKIRWTKQAANDLENIHAYIADDSEYYAQRFAARIIEAVDRLGRFPRMGKVVAEADDENIRELLYRTYRIIYMIRDETVVVLAIVHGHRDTSSMQPKPWDVG